jgi:DNA gyrase subunit B
MKKPADYNSSHIEIRGGLDGVRTNSSMYLGSTDAHGVFLSVRELLDNALDEHLAGRNKAVRLHIDADGSYWVLDQGTGIPQGIKEVHLHVNGEDIINKLPTMQAVFGELHTSGKYRTEAYLVSVGSHGIGSKGTNACAEFFDVVTLYKGSWYSVGFKKGKLTSPVTKLSKPPKGPDGTALALGTCIHFKPDPTIFTAKSFPSSLAVEWAEIMSYLNPGFAIVISSPKSRKTFLSKTGPLEYVTTRIAKLKAEQISPLVFEYKTELADLVVAFTNCEGSEVRGFTNGLSNPEGGTHVSSAVDALYDGLCAALIKAGKEKLVQSKPKKGEKGKKPVFRSADFKEGLVGLINAKLHKAQFASQNKAKLTDPRMGKEYLQLATVAATAFFSKEIKLAVMLAERATKLAALKFNFSKSKKLVASLGALKRKGMPIKYAPPNKSTKISERECVVVEGESAGGGAKDARFPFQGVLPLKGKPINSIKAKGDKALESEEIINILGAIGFDPKASDPYSKLQVGKIVCLADPDPDGRHINTLLLALFYKYLPELFIKGMVYIVKAPEFYAIHNGKIYTGDGSSALRAKLDKDGVPAKTVINHIKGWGEIDSSMVRILAMDPATRELIKIKPLEDGDSQFSKLMDDDPEVRKTLLGVADEEAGAE